MRNTEAPEPPPVYDPLYLNSRREALLILVALLVCLVWTVGYSAVAGYQVAPGEVTLILGMPAWVFWGVLVPWLAATAFSIWFGLVYIADDDLGTEDSPDGRPPHA